MKKIFALIVIFLILVSGTKVKHNFSLLDYFSGEYYAYSKKPISKTYVNLGTCFMNYGDINTSSNLVGESITIKNLEPASALEQLNAYVVATEILDNGATIIYAYSTKIKSKVKIFDKEVNLQIANYENYSIIGWPLILGSY